MRQRAQLPRFVRFEIKPDGSAYMSFMCVCEEAVAVETFVHLEEGSSSAEGRCPQCGRMVQIRASRVM